MLGLADIAEIDRLLDLAVGVVIGGAFGAIILFAAAKIEKDDQFFNILGRLVIMPMFLFSGTFFPLSIIYCTPSNPQTLAISWGSLMVPIVP